MKKIVLNDAESLELVGQGFRFYLTVMPLNLDERFSYGLQIITDK